VINNVFVNTPSLSFLLLFSKVSFVDSCGFAKDRFNFHLLLSSDLPHHERSGGSGCRSPHILKISALLRRLNTFNFLQKKIRMFQSLYGIHGKENSRAFSGDRTPLYIATQLINLVPVCLYDLGRKIHGGIDVMFFVADCSL
jgi:hypothetical protein